MLKVLFVCTGNQCRSPFAEAYLRRLAPEWVDLDSAGTAPQTGAPPPAHLIAVAEHRGLELAGHRARRVDSDHVRDADLILGMALEHVAQTVVELGADPARAFVFGEFLRLLDTLRAVTPPGPKGTLRVIKEVHEARARNRHFVAGEEVADPIGGPPSEYVAMADAIESLCDRLATGFSWT